MSAENITLTLTPDEALVLFEFFSRWDESDQLAFGHAAGYLVLVRIAAQLEKGLVEPFSPAYRDLLEAARTRLAEGIGGEYPGPHVAP